eukprot:Em0008g1082a
MVVAHNMNPCSNDNLTLTQCGISEGDIVLIMPPIPLRDVPAPTVPSQNQFPVINWGEVSLPSVVTNANAPPTTNLHQLQDHVMQEDEDFLDRDDPVVMRQYFASNPAAFAHLEENNPPLAEALLGGNDQVFADCWRQMRVVQREQERERIRMLNADPFDTSVQARIASEINQSNIMENLAAAIEHNPESFGRVVMLYVDCQVNGVHVKALVDSGAAATIMSSKCAERCGIMRLVDRRFAGMAVGIGRQRILGRVHVCQVQIGRDFLASSFQVLEDQVEDMLLGLDMLKRHQCSIDLKEGVLRIGTTASVTPFLSEKDLQDKMHLLEHQSTEQIRDADADLASAISESERTSFSPGRSTNASTNVTHPQPHVSPQLTVSEASIQAITSAGFTRQQAIEELRRSNGNVQLALTALLASSIRL